MTLRYGLDESTIERICGVFEKFPEVDQAILYGSRAKGNFKHGSDIDITLLGQPLTHEILNRIITSMDELMLPYTFDISIRDTITNVDLIAHIARVGIIFYKREG